MMNSASIAQYLQDNRLTYTQLADRTAIVLLLDGRQVLSLNESAVCIVEALRAGVTDEEELVAGLISEFEVDEATARRDVSAFLRTLEQHLKR